jgi:hypothetical protein
MVLDDIDVGVKAKHLLEAMYEGLLVQPVGLLANAVDEGAIHICIAAQQRTLWVGSSQWLWLVFAKTAALLATKDIGSWQATLCV